MAEATIAAIVALQRRAEDLDRKGGPSAAAEKYREAAVLAERLPGLPADNLVAVHMLLGRCSALDSQTLQTSKMSGCDSEGSRRHFEAAVSLLLPAIASLNRRWDAGTLLPDRCAATEEAWYTAQLADDASVLEQASWTDIMHAQYAQLVGLDSLYFAAYESLRALCACPPIDRQKHLPNILPQIATLLVRAFDKIKEARPMEHGLLLPEMSLVGIMPNFLGGMGAFLAEHFPAEAARPLRGIGLAWSRVQASGVLQRRRLHEGNQIMTQSLEGVARSEEAAVERTARRGLRSCGLASCGAKEAHVDHFKRCSACKTIVYCCKEHQVQDWPAHKKACKAARKAAAEDQ
jgi:hypothetical protein